MIVGFVLGMFCGVGLGVLLMSLMFMAREADYEATNG